MDIYLDRIILILIFQGTLLQENKSWKEEKNKLGKKCHFITKWPFKNK